MGIKNFRKEFWVSADMLKRAGDRPVFCRPAANPKKGTALALFKRGMEGFDDGDFPMAARWLFKAGFPRIFGDYGNKKRGRQIICRPPLGIFTCLSSFVFSYIVEIAFYVVCGPVFIRSLASVHMVISCFNNLIVIPCACSIIREVLEVSQFTFFAYATF